MPSQWTIKVGQDSMPMVGLTFTLWDVCLTHVSWLWPLWFLKKWPKLQNSTKNFQSQRILNSRSRLSIDGSFELHSSSRCMHDPSFLALALTVSENMTYRQKNSTKCYWSVKSRSRLSSNGSFELHSSRCMKDPRFLALALIVSEKMT